MDNYVNRPQQQPQQAYGWYFATREEALNWRIALGSFLVFLDPDRTRFYTKSLGYSPYEKPVFLEYELKKEGEEPAPQVTQASLPEDVDLREDIFSLKQEIGNLAAAIANMNQKPKYYDKEKKVDNK